MDDMQSTKYLFDSKEKQILNIVMAAQYIPIKRYNVQEDKIYGDPENKDIRYKILRISGNDIVYKNLKTDYENLKGNIEYIESKVLDDTLEVAVEEKEKLEKVESEEDIKSSTENS